MKKTTQAEAEVVPSSRLVEVEVGVPRTLVEVIPSVFQWEKKKSTEVELGLQVAVEFDNRNLYRDQQFVTSKYIEKFRLNTIFSSILHLSPAP